MYGMSEYLMLMHEVQKARMADRARKAEVEADERYGMIRHSERVPRVKVRSGLETHKVTGSKGATR